MTLFIIKIWGPGPHIMPKTDITKQYLGSTEHHAKPYRFKSLVSKGAANKLGRKAARKKNKKR